MISCGNPKVTVIVLAYNQQESVGQAIESVLAQDCPFPYEILVGEDASADATRAVCLDYASRFPGKVRLMPEAPNKGLVRNYFDCLAAARGEYIADVAGDDFWNNRGKLSMQAAFLDLHPEAVLVHTGWTPIDAATGMESELVIQDLPELYDGEEVVESLLNHRSPVAVHLSAALYRKDAALEEFNADPEFFSGACAEDFTLLCCLARGRRVGYIPVSTLSYRKGGENSLSGDYDKGRAARFYARSVEMTEATARKLSVPRKRYGKGLGKMIRYALGLALQSGDREAVEYLKETLRRNGLQLPMRSKVKLALKGRVREVLGIRY